MKLMFSLLVATTMWATSPVVHMAVQASGHGFVDTVPELSSHYETVEGVRGCVDGAEKCEQSRQLVAMRAHPLAGESMVVFIAGSDAADHVTVTRGGQVVLAREQVQLPAEIPLAGVLLDGETISVVVRTGNESIEHSAHVRKQGASVREAVYNVRITNYVLVRGEWWEVIEGSRTGGNFVRQNRTDGASGYTDRVSRGEHFGTFWNGSGCGERVGWKYKGSGRTYAPAGCLPLFDESNVSVNPADDYLYAFAQSPYYEKHIPIGTR